MRIATSNRGMPFSSWEQESQVEMVKAVRKGICPALREILTHGLVQPNKTTSLVPFLSCAVPRTGPSSDSCANTFHPWQIFVAFYRTKDGQSLMATPQRSLAQSFSLEIQGGTSKQSLLVAIGNVIVMHQPYKRGPEAHFKAFLSSALKLVFHCNFFIPRQLSYHIAYISLVQRKSYLGCAPSCAVPLYSMNSTSHGLSSSNLVN